MKTLQEKLHNIYLQKLLNQNKNNQNNQIIQNYLQDTQNLTEDLQTLFQYSCALGYIDTVKFLTTHTPFKKHLDVNYNEDISFRHAAHNGRLEVVKYLLTSQDIKTPNIQAKDNYAIKKAAQYGKLDLFQFLTTSSFIKEKGNVNLINEDKCEQNVWKWICKYKQIEKEFNQLTQSKKSIKLKKNLL